MKSFTHQITVSTFWYLGFVGASHIAQICKVPAKWAGRALIESLRRDEAAFMDVGTAIAG